jgi:hypothetical protein
MNDHECLEECSKQRPESKNINIWRQGKQRLGHDHCRTRVAEVRARLEWGSRVEGKWDSGLHGIILMVVMLASRRQFVRIEAEAEAQKAKHVFKLIHQLLI